MAFSRPSQQEKDNYCGFNDLVEFGMEILRDILDNYIRPCDLQRAVNAQKRRNRDVNKVYLDYKQIIQGVAGKGNYKDFDVTALYTILRNLRLPGLGSPTKGWGKKPDLNDTLLEDDIERIREFRNKCQHMTAHALSDTEYQNIVKDFQKLCSRMDGRTIKSAKTRPHTYYQILCNLLKQPVQVDAKDIREMQDTLYKAYEGWEMIPIHPLDSETIHIENIFEPVLIEEDISNKSGRSLKKKTIDKAEEFFLTESGQELKRIFLRGQAGRGKTVFCLQRLEDWKTATKGSKGDMNNWEQCFAKLNFACVFYIPLREVKDEKIVTEMICKTLYPGCPDLITKAQNILRAPHVKCLVILDGLDEWPNDDLPFLYGLQNTCVLFTTRSWKLETMRVEFSNERDKVVDILGLTAKGIENVISNVLINHFGLDRNSEEFKKKSKNFTLKAKSYQYQSLVNIPVLTSTFCFLWNNENEDACIGKNMTTLYFALIEQMIEKSISRDPSLRELIERKKEAPNRSHSRRMGRIFPTTKWAKEIVAVFSDLNLKHVPHCMEMFLSMGEVAFQDFMKEKTQLVFDPVNLSDQLGDNTLDFARRTGLICESHASSSFLSRQVTVNFFHKTIQELFTALCIVCRKNYLREFMRRCSTVDQTLDFHIIATFVAGLNTHMAVEISRHISKIAKKDAHIESYREGFINSYGNELFNAMSKMYAELSTSSTLPADLHRFIFSDVYVQGCSYDFKEKIITCATKIMQNNYHHVKSLYHHGNPDDMSFSIPEDVLLQFLRKASSLRHLHLYGIVLTGLTSNLLSKLSVLSLWRIRLTDQTLMQLERSIKQNVNLRKLTLWYIRCRDILRVPLNLTLKTKHSLEVHLGDVHLNQVQFQGDCLTKLVIAEHVYGSVSDLLKHLPRCNDFTELHVTYLENKEHCDLLVLILPRLYHLRRVQYRGTRFGYSNKRYDGVAEPRTDPLTDRLIVQTIFQLKQLEDIDLWYVWLADTPVNISPLLKTLSLHFVEIDPDLYYRIKATTTIKHDNVLVGTELIIRDNT